MAHITGGGIVENVPRVLPRHCQAVIEKDSWPKPPIFEILRNGGNIEEIEMYRTFNYGLGMVLIVSEKDVEDILVRLSGLKEHAYLIGSIVKFADCGEQVSLV
jgi:phosphoribosylformylglycinamidine cyclo-ligase